MCLQSRLESSDCLSISNNSVVAVSSRQKGQNERRHGYLGSCTDIDSTIFHDFTKILRHLSSNLWTTYIQQVHGQISSAAAIVSGRPVSGRH